MGTDRTSPWSSYITAGRAGSGLHIVLRLPHTTHVLQGEDVQYFTIFKPQYLRAKYELTQARLFLGKSPRLTAGDLLLCAKEAWQTAFNLAQPQGLG